MKTFVENMAYGGVGLLYILCFGVTVYALFRAVFNRISRIAIPRKFPTGKRSRSEQ
jgi:hypothetical protein